ncbi:MAG: acyl-CoA/acyl-ACP dehydrogenase [Spirochaetia bacterium]|nr:acyl-CoA/acyl-ACP dehydrogenase [Spirochaetia bacterium]
MKEKVQSLNKKMAELLVEITNNLAKRSAEGGRLSVSKMDENQLVHYNLAYHTAENRIGEHFVNYAHDPKNGTSAHEQNMATLFVSESAHRLRSEVASRAEEYGLSNDTLNELFSSDMNKLIQETQTHKIYDAVGDEVLAGKFGALATDDYSEIRDTYRKFSDNVVAPKAEHVHRGDEFVPDEILNGLVEQGAFGLSIPEKYGGFQDMVGNIGMMIVTEELSRGGLSIAGSLITRPEILSKAILKGGTEQQKETWLAALAAGEKMCAVAVTEPDFGSDVAGMKVTADKVEGGWRINGVKTWCTFAGYADTLLVLARTEKDPALKHKGLSIILAEKPRDKGHRFEYTQPEGGKMSGSAIPTIGYRGMHSFEVNFDNYFAPDANLIGGEAGRGKGFYLQMEGFAGGRAQTAARANGVMQASLDTAVRYANERKVFGKPVGSYQITKWKLARMAMLLQASRQYGYHVARLMDDHKGSMEATLVKFYASKVSEWVAREAMQIHGGMGYAEEYAVSRYYVDARVFSIFEGAEEVMALRVCARDLLEQALSGAK